MTRKEQVKQIKTVMQEELTDLQRYTLIAYYFENRTLVQIADACSVNKSTICRTLKRAEDKLRRFLQ